jgi:hypothetical protein
MNDFRPKSLNMLGEGKKARGMSGRQLNVTMISGNFICLVTVAANA